MTQIIRCYEELRKLETLEERFKYLALRGGVGAATFGFDRYINQGFYTSREWRHIRQAVIARDLGCDLGVEGYEIHSKVLIHHMNPMAVVDIKEANSMILDTEFLITTTLKTHNAIHYGDERQLPQPLAPRTRGDTKVW